MDEFLSERQIIALIVITTFAGIVPFAAITIVLMHIMG
jgi:hypothetical protein